MKKISTVTLFLFCSIIFGGLYPIAAQPIGEGFYAIYGFDFSSDTEEPPFYGFNNSLDLYLYVDPFTTDATFEFALWDSGHVYSGAGAGINGTDGSWIGGNGLSSPDVVFSDDVIFGTFLVTEGSVNINSWTLSLLGQYVDGVTRPETEEVSGEFLFIAQNPVPEPTSILLLSVGLIGFAGFRKKFKK